MKHEPEELNPSGKLNEAQIPTAREAFGLMLKQAREEAGFSIERVAMATRITQPFVEALEKGATDKLPGAIFVRGFIRNLCKAYGKDPKGFLLAFDELCGDSMSKDSRLSSKDDKRHQQLQRGVLLIQPNEWKKRLKVFAPQNYLQLKPFVFLGGTALLLILGISAVRFGFDTNKISPDPAQTKVAEVPETSSAPPAVTDSSLQVSDKNLAPLPSELDLEIKVKEAVNVTYTKDQEKQVSEKLEVQSYKFLFKEQFKLVVSDASRVEIYFRGHRVAEDVVPNQPRRFVFAAPEAEIAGQAVPTKL